MKIGPFTISLNSKKDKDFEVRERKNKKNEKGFFVKAVRLINNYAASREGFEYPEFDLQEIKIASISDSYIKIALGKYANLVFKAGYTLKGDNQKALDYVKTRWKVMGLATKQSMDLLFEGISKDVVTFGNCFLLKVRTKEENLGGIKAQGMKNRNPIGGYYRIPPETISIKRDQFGNVLKYRQVAFGEEKEYSPDDIIHIFIDKDSNSAFGTPRIQAALEDVKMLRRIEGNILNLIYRFAIPIYQWKIGKAEAGFQASDRDIEEARREIEGSSMDGVYITNEKTDIKAIGVENSALDATGYLRYFEQRVFSALEVSMAQMGRESTSANADSVETQIHDTVKYIQRMIKEKIQNEMINEILIEGGFDPIFNEKDEVNFVFNEISLDTKVKIENHELMKYQSNLITLDEARKGIGKEILDKKDEERLYQSLIVDASANEQAKNSATQAIRISKEQHKLQMEMQKENLKARELNAEVIESDIKEKPDGKNMLGNGTAKGKTTNKEVENTAMPENQYGKTSVKINEENKDIFNNLCKMYTNTCNILIRDKNSISYKENLVQKEFKEISNYFNKASSNLIDLTEKENKKEFEKIKTGFKKDLTEIAKDINKNKGSYSESFDLYSYRLKSLSSYYLNKVSTLSSKNKEE